MSELALEIKNVSKSFQIHENRADSLKENIARVFSSKKNTATLFHALDNVSVKVKKGESLGIIGRNGAGKSTLLRILSGIMQPDTGEINFYGKPVSILDIGAGFHPELSGRENIFLSASLYNFTKAKIEEKYQEIVDFSGVENFIEEPVKNYSAGMYLRLAFSIITCLEADIYLIDEVINVGDANFQMKCKAKIEELIAQGKTLLIASHNLNEISTLCNRIVLMENGKILDIGTSDAIQKYFTIAIPEYFSFDEGKAFHLKEKNEIHSGVEQISILNYGLKDYEATFTGISNQKPISLFVEVEITEPVKISFGMQFCDITGVVAFTASTLARGSVSEIIEKGKYQITFLIPPHLLNEKMYAVNFTLVGEKKVLMKIDKLITLKISDGTETINAVVLPGVVKPIINSVIENIA